MDLVLSDVHTADTSKPHLWKEGLSITRFKFRLDGVHDCDAGKNIAKIEEGNSEPCFKKPRTENTNACFSGSPGDLMYDEDGDLIVERPSKTQPDSYYITILHRMSTCVDEVGQQVWNGALLMCDFILYNRDMFRNIVICDLGAGVGLTSIIAGMFAKAVFSTDTGDKVLDLALKNIQNNEANLPFNKCMDDGMNQCESNILVKELDWFSDNLLHEEFISKYCFSDKDMDIFKTVKYLLAADVIYDDDITDAFFRTIHSLMSERPAKTLFIALEKRIVFTTKDLDVSSPAYQHFQDCLKDLLLLNEEGGVTYHFKQIPVVFPHFFQYRRLKEMELWEITSKFPD